MAEGLDSLHVALQCVQPVDVLDRDDGLHTRRNRVLDRQVEQVVTAEPHHRQNVLGLRRREAGHLPGRLGDLDRGFAGIAMSDEARDRPAARRDAHGVARQRAVRGQQPQGADGGVTAHLHLVVGHPEAKGEIVVRARWWQHESRFMPVLPSHGLHVDRREPLAIDHDRAGIAAAPFEGEHADEIDMRLHGGSLLLSAHASHGKRGAKSSVSLVDSR